MVIREARAADWPQIWPFFHRIVTAGESYAYDPDLTADDAEALWMVGPPGRTIVAASAGKDGRVVGTATMYANRQGRGGHVASASFMVDPDHAGQGIGRMLAEDTLAWARSEGFLAMQFNAVVETNIRAVKLWRSLGFEVVGTVREAFEHPEHGYVGLHVMWRRL